MSGVATSVLAQGRDKEIVTVEVLEAHSFNSYTETSCQTGDCSGAVGAVINATTSRYNQLVTASIKMPDGRIAKASCFTYYVWNSCAEPSVGQYRARIRKHDIRLFISFMDKPPEYNADGTLKKPAKYSTREVRFKVES
jgi:hypothetical protein